MRDDMPRPNVIVDPQPTHDTLGYVDRHDNPVEPSRIDVFLLGVAFGTIVTGCIVDALHLLGAF